MLYLIFSLIIAWLVYNVVNLSIKNQKQQKLLTDRIDKLEEKNK